MKRGDIVIARGSGEFTTKPRPYVIVQSDAAIADSVTLSVCPLTSQLTGSHLIRIRIDPDSSNGLKRPSEIEVDLIVSMRKAGFDEVIGVAAPETMGRVDDALRRWLAL